MPANLFFLALCALWFASEAWINRRRSIDGARRGDAGTLRRLHLTIAASVAVAVGLALAGAWRFPPAARPWLHGTGMALMLAGMALRWWAIRVLARQFTVDVSVQPGHELIRHGPYRRVRHPAYTGALLSFLGFALALGTWSSLLAVMVPVTLAFLHRIRVEERVLADAFPGAYPAYARTTWRLLPYVW